MTYVAVHVDLWNGIIVYPFSGIQNYSLKSDLFREQTFEVAVSEGPTVNVVKYTFVQWGAVKDKQFSWIIVMSMILPSGVWCLASLASCAGGKLCNTISLIPLFNGINMLLFRKKQKSPDTQTAQILASLLTAKKSEHWCSTTPPCTTLQFYRKLIIAIMK